MAPSAPTPIVQQVARSSVADSLHRRLRTAIIEGEVEPGAHLPSERTLAEQAGVNRQAVREALQRLRQQGLVEIVQGEGVRVLDWVDHGRISVLTDAALRPDGSLNLEIAFAVLRLRMVTLADAAHQASGRCSGEQIRQMRDLIDAGDRDDDLEPRLALWDVVVDASGNLAYRLVYNSQQAVAARLPQEARALLTAGPSMSDDYSPLVDALEAGDGDRAADAARSILGRVIQQVEGRL